MRFAEFEVDPKAGILRRNGERVKLQDLPFRLLVVLLNHPGEVVTRDQIRAELWGAGTFVDAEAGLNTAIAKLREALGDDAETPRFIETLPKRGYRFVGQVTPETAQTVALPVVPAKRHRWIAAAGLAVIVAGFAGYRVYLSPNPVTIAVVRFHNETGAAEHDRLAGTLTDAVVVALAQNRKYGVIGNSPLLRTDRIFADVQRIGTALAADFVVLGQLQEGDAGMLARLHFIRVSDQKHLWAGRVDLGSESETERRVTTAAVEGVAVGLGRQ